MTKESIIWLFDAHCVLCSRAVAFTLRYEKHDRIQFMSLQSDSGRELAARHGIDPQNPDSFLFLVDGVAQRKSDGVLALAKQLRFPFVMLRVLSLLPRPVRDKLYDCLAKNRYRLFGQFDRCMVPAPETRDRFVLPDDRGS